MKQFLDTLCSKEKEISDLIHQNDFVSLNSLIQNIYFSDSNIQNSEFNIPNDNLNRTISTVDLISNISFLSENLFPSKEETDIFISDKESILNTPLIQIIDKF